MGLRLTSPIRMPKIAQLFPCARWAELRKWLEKEFATLKSRDAFFTRRLEQIESTLIMKTKELADALDALTAQEAKIAKEQSDRFDVLTARIKELEDAVANADVPSEVTDALKSLQAAAQSLDDAIPDAPPAAPQS